MIYDIFIIILLGCSFMCLYRVGKGPTPPDRTVAIDIFGIVVVGFCAIFALTTGKDFYLNVAIAWSLLSYIGTLALAKHLEGRGYDE